MVWLVKEQIAGEAGTDFVQISVSITRMYCKRIAFFCSYCTTEMYFVCSNVRILFIHFCCKSFLKQHHHR